MEWSEGGKWDNCNSIINKYIKKNLGGTNWGIKKVTKISEHMDVLTLRWSTVWSVWAALGGLMWERQVLLLGWQSEKSVSISYIDEIARVLETEWSKRVGFGGLQHFWSIYIELISLCWVGYAALKSQLWPPPQPTLHCLHRTNLKTYVEMQNRQSLSDLECGWHFRNLLLFHPIFSLQDFPFIILGRLELTGSETFQNSLVWIMLVLTFLYYQLKTQLSGLFWVSYNLSVFHLPTFCCYCSHSCFPHSCACMSL